MLHGASAFSSDASAQHANMGAMFSQASAFHADSTTDLPTWAPLHSMLTLVSGMSTMPHLCSLCAAIPVRSMQTSATGMRGSQISNMSGFPQCLFLPHRQWQLACQTSHGIQYVFEGASRSITAVSDWDPTRSQTRSTSSECLFVVATPSLPSRPREPSASLCRMASCTTLPQAVGSLVLASALVRADTGPSRPSTRPTAPQHRAPLFRLCA